MSSRAIHRANKTPVSALWGDLDALSSPQSERTADRWSTDSAKMTKILTACIGVLVLLAMHFSTQVSCQNSSVMTNATSFASTTISTITSRNGTNHTTPNGAGSMVLPAGLSLLLPIGLLSSVLHGHW